MICSKVRVMDIVATNKRLKVTNYKITQIYQY